MNKFRLTLFVLLFLSLGYWFWFNQQAPAYFPMRVPVLVSSGGTVGTIGRELARQGVIRSPLFFRIFVGLRGRSGNLLAGNYWFERPLALSEVVSRLASGDFNTEQIKVTLPEGLTVSQMARILDKKLDHFNTDLFLRLAAKFQGELFPDTYFFAPAVTETEVVEALRRNFAHRLTRLEPQLTASEHSLADVVIMASLVEKEASDQETRRLISGILWKRLAAGHPLQVDAVFPYLIGKNSFNLTRDDLALDSPYNTYKYKGLPPGPIANPGLDSITAALEPIESDYLFYLADYAGQTHYAKDFAEHKENKQKYLKA